MKHDDFNVQYHIKRGQLCRDILTSIRMLCIKEGGPIEWRRTTFAFAPKAKKFGGISDLLWELEAEGSIFVDIVPSLRGIMKTITIPELLRRKA